MAGPFGFGGLIVAFRILDVSMSLSDVRGFFMEKNRAQQNEMRRRSSSELPFVDNRLVEQTAKAIRKNASADRNSKVKLPYGLSSREQSAVLNAVGRTHGGLVERISFTNADVDGEAGTEIYIKRRERR